MTKTSVAEDGSDEQEKRTITLEELRRRAEAGELSEVDQKVLDDLTQKVQELMANSTRHLNEAMARTFAGLKDSINLKVDVPEIHLSLPKLTIAGLGGAFAKPQPLRAIDVSAGSNGNYVVKLNRRLDRVEEFIARTPQGPWTITGDEIHIALLEDDADLVARYTEEAIRDVTERTHQARTEDAERKKAMDATAEEAKRKLGLGDANE